MPTVHPGLYKRGRFWYYNVSAHGHRSHGSTRATDLTTARMVLEGKRRELLHQIYSLTKKVKSFEEVAREWYQVNRAIFSKGHLKSSESVLRNWVYPSIGSLPADEILYPRAAELRSLMLEKGCSPTFVNNTIKLVRAVLNYAVNREYIKSVPFRLPKLKVQKQPRAIVPASRIHEFFAEVDRATKNSQIQVMLRVMVGLGLREAEVLGMRWEWFDFDQKTYCVGVSKGKEARVIPVPTWLWNAIHDMPKSVSPWVFPAPNGEPHCPQLCKKTLYRVCKDMGLGNVTHHRLRATFASLHAEAGTPLPEIQGMLGHKQITTTMIYVEQSLGAKRRAQDALSQKLGLA